MNKSSTNSPFQLILASASPRRQLFLRELGLTFHVLVADIDETPLPNEAPLALVQRLAEGKAQAVAHRLASQLSSADRANVLIIAADTVVALGNQLLGKPVDDADARAMLRTLHNRVHDVHTGVSVLALGDTAAYNQQRTRIVTSQVQMRDYSEAEMEAYIASGDPFDKAGAYAIQHPEFHPVCAVTGCVTSVIGLPLAAVRDLLAEWGVPVTQPIIPICQQRTPFGCCQV